MEIPFPQTGQETENDPHAGGHPNRQSFSEVDVSAIAQAGHRQRRKSHRRQTRTGGARGGGLAGGGTFADRGRSGVAKTMLARAMAQSAGSTFKRIQCAPDLLPSDVLGEAYLTGRPDEQNSVLARSFRSSCSWTKSTAPARARNRRFWRRWARHGHGGQRHLPPAKTVHGGRHAKSHRAGRHVSAAGGAKGPLPDADEPRLSVAGRRKANGRALSIAPSH